MDRRGWNLALGFQEVFTAVVRVRYNRQAVQDAETFRAQMRQALRVAEQDARSHGCSPEDVNQVIFGVVAFLDESVLSSGNPVFANWPRLPLQAELFGHQLAGEMFFQELQKALSRPDSQEVADLLEVYYLCLLLGFKGRYAAGGDLRSIMSAIDQQNRWQGSIQHPLRQGEQGVLAALGVVEALQRGRRGTQDDRDVLQASPHHGHVAGMVARRRFLLEGAFVFLVDHD